MHRRYPGMRTWDPHRRVLPSEHDRCDAAAQGDTGTYTTLFAEDLYFRCSFRRRNATAPFCMRHAEAALVATA